MVERNIDRIGNLGDGVVEAANAETADGIPAAGPLFVPFGLPGETWAINDDGVATLITPAPDRATPLCQHFTICGGCRAQHMPSNMYAAWKRARIVDALAQAQIVTPDGQDTRVLEPILSGRGTRRRAVLTASRNTDGGGNDRARVSVGYYARATHALVDIAHCPVWVPQLEAALPDLRAIAHLTAPKRGDLRITVLASETGLDVAVTGADHDPDAEVRAQLSGYAERAGIARLLVNGRDVIQRAEPALTIDGVRLLVPPATFVQATAKAEAAMINRVVTETQGARAIADLFSGIGTFALALSRGARITAYDSDTEAVDAMTRAHNHTQNRKPVEGVVRDLFREPLARKELEPFDAVVFDPPRAGARAQAEQLAKSNVPTVVAVSCNPQTFARDAKTLVDGGYEMGPVLPIDQFVFSEHVELIAAFRKPSVGRKGGRRLSGRGRR
ncbi:MAG: RsmD family RNA methyltransferase [Pseudomonadota bacterium]